MAALQATPRRKPPGWDELPAELYKAFDRQSDPLRAALYTAIGIPGSLPARFTDGIIKVLYKKGDPTAKGHVLFLVGPGPGDLLSCSPRVSVWPGGEFIVGLPALTAE
jgi:hypothetical protein